MSYFVSLVLVSFIASFTPGPNNSMLMQSGMMFGFKKTIPLILGVFLGFNILFQTINFGLYALISIYPSFLIILKSVGTLYFIYLAYKMTRLKPDTDTKNSQVALHNKTQVIGFWGIFFFQWLNIKAWFFAISVIATLPADRIWVDQIVIGLVILSFTIASASTWTLLGTYLHKIFKSPKSLKIVNIILALFLVYAAIAQWFQGL